MNAQFLDCSETPPASCICLLFCPTLMFVFCVTEIFDVEPAAGGPAEARKCFVERWRRRFGASPGLCRQVRGVGLFAHRELE